MGAVASPWGPGVALASPYTKVRSVFFFLWLRKEAKESNKKARLRKPSRVACIIQLYTKELLLYKERTCIIHY